MSLLDAFGLITIMTSLVCYHFEARRPALFTLGFAVTCAMGSFYGFKKEAFPFGIVEVFWALSAFKKFLILRRENFQPSTLRAKVVHQRRDSGVSEDRAIGQDYVFSPAVVTASLRIHSSTSSEPRSKEA